MEHDAGQHGGEEQTQAARQPLGSRELVVGWLGEDADPQMTVPEVLTGLEHELVQVMIIHVGLTER